MGDEFVTAYMGSEPYIFVSYAHQDKDTVLDSVRWMDNNGYRVWYDEGIEFGEDFPTNISEKLENCFQFVVFISNNSISRRWVRKEIKLAEFYEKRILPVYIDDIVFPKDIEHILAIIQGIRKFEIAEGIYYRYLDKGLKKECKKPDARNSAEQNEAWNNTQTQSNTQVNNTQTQNNSQAQNNAQVNNAQTHNDTRERTIFQCEAKLVPPWGKCALKGILTVTQFRIIFDYKTNRTLVNIFDITFIRQEAFHADTATAKTMMYMYAPSLVVKGIINKVNNNKGVTVYCGNAMYKFGFDSPQTADELTKILNEQKSRMKTY